MDTLFYTADRGQCAERLGVHAPEAVLPADLEERYNSTFLWRREYHMILPGDLPWIDSTIADSRHSADMYVLGYSSHTRRQ